MGSPKEQKATGGKAGNPKNSGQPTGSPVQAAATTGAGAPGSAAPGGATPLLAMQMARQQVPGRDPNANRASARGTGANTRVPPQEQAGYDTMRKALAAAFQKGGAPGAPAPPGMPGAMPGMPMMPGMMPGYWDQPHAGIVSNAGRTGYTTSGRNVGAYANPGGGHSSARWGGGYLA
jgi:hypothetical protein